MASRNIVPRADGEGGIGTSLKKWGNAYFDDMIELSKFNTEDASELTVATGVIAVTQMFHSVDTQADAASDDLDTINGGAEGDIVFLIPEDSARVVTLKNGTGNILTINGNDLSLHSPGSIVLLMHDGINWRVFGDSNVLTELIKNASDFTLDSTDVGSDKGTAWGIIESVDYDPDTDGAAWISFKLPVFWDASDDIKFDLYYNLDGLDNSHTIDLEFDSWCVAEGETPAIGAPTESDTWLLSSGVAQNDAMRILTHTTSAFQITAANITSGDVISVRIRRDADDVGNDTYTGTFQLIKLRIYQSA